MNANDARNLLVIVTVYEHPRDYPDEYVAREDFIETDGTIRKGPIIARTLSLDSCRDVLLEKHPFLYRLPRNPCDDPVIVETWI